jgi:large subunit ribosomal protein L32
MAVPARHTSKQKKRSRRGHIKLSVPAMHYDATTGEYRLTVFHQRVITRVVKL